VRQMALGGIEFANARTALYKEITIAVLNGLLFALLMGVIAWAWFQQPLLGVVIGMAMIINLFIAGFFGASIPLLLKRLNIDPAVGSTVLLTTATDVFGFFSFLGLAQVILL
jgi:magnesium transporter